MVDGAAFAVLPAVSTSVGEKWTEASKRGGQCCPAREEKQEKDGAGGRIFFARSRVAPKRWSLASSLCVASAFCDSEKRTTLSMSGSGHRGVLHAISKSNAPQLLNYCRHSRRNRRRRENARLRVFPQENSCLIKGFGVELVRILDDTSSRIILEKNPLFFLSLLLPTSVADGDID